LKEKKMSDAQMQRGGIGSQGIAPSAAYLNAPRNTAALPTPVNPSCFGNIEDVTGTCSTAANRVERAVDRLCGVVPTADSTRAGNEIGGPNGLFDAADRQARDIRGSMDRIFAALDRLEKHLP
jgi:hypothetical protein